MAPKINAAPTIEPTAIPALAPALNPLLDFSAVAVVGAAVASAAVGVAVAEDAVDEGSLAVNSEEVTLKHITFSVRVAASTKVYAIL